VDGTHRVVFPENGIVFRENANITPSLSCVTFFGVFWHFRLPGRRFFEAAFSRKTQPFSRKKVFLANRLPGRRFYGEAVSGELPL
jgi:hypothetical protein